MIGAVDVKIKPRVNAKGHPFTEIFYTYDEDGEPRRALTRVWHVIPDSPHAAAAEREAFLRRRARHG